MQGFHKHGTFGFPSFLSPNVRQKRRIGFNILEFHEDPHSEVRLVKVWGLSTPCLEHPVMSVNYLNLNITSFPHRLLLLYTSHRTKRTKTHPRQTFNYLCTSRMQNLNQKYCNLYATTHNSSVLFCILSNLWEHPLPW